MVVIAILNSFYVVVGPILAPIPNSILIERKTQKLCRNLSVLAGRAGRSKNSCSQFKHSVSVQRISNGWSGRSVWMKLAPEFGLKANSHAVVEIVQEREGSALKGNHILYLRTQKIISLFFFHRPPALSADTIWLRVSAGILYEHSPLTRERHSFCPPFERRYKPKTIPAASEAL